jgi:acyl dehydratase
MALITVSSFEEFNQHLNKDMGSSEPHQITQDQINLFADATLDHQWIHTDPQKAASGPFGKTIAHGYLTLSMVPNMWNQILEAKNLRMMVNYGIEKLKFGLPVEVEDSIVLHAHLENLSDIRGIVKAEVGARMEILGKKKPAFTGTLIILYHFNA